MPEIKVTTKTEVYYEINFPFLKGKFDKKVGIKKKKQLEEKKENKVWKAYKDWWNKHFNKKESHIIQFQEP